MDFPRLSFPAELDTRGFGSGSNLDPNEPLYRRETIFCQLVVYGIVDARSRLAPAGVLQTGGKAEARVRPLRDLDMLVNWKRQTEPRKEAMRKCIQ